MLLPDRITHVRHIDQRRVLQFFLRVVGGVLKIAFIQFEQRTVNGLAAIGYKQTVHVLFAYSRVYRVVDYLVEVTLVDEHEQLAFQLKFLLVLQVTLLELLLLVCFGGPADLWVLVLLLLLYGGLRLVFVNHIERLMIHLMFFLLLGHSVSRTID
jgi:hypothetical protein